jgi:tryptophan 2-monooxygenase
MPVMPNMRRRRPRSAFEAVAPTTPVAFVDTPKMDYATWLTNSGDRIATVPNASDYEVAVIGSGGAGLSAAYELLRCGFSVTLYEATDRIGGRLYTSPSATGDGNVFELGAMRFTPSEQVLHYYADVFNASGASTITFDTGAFPDPGVYLTYIAFQGQTYIYDPNSAVHVLPPSYYTCGDGWELFLENGFTSADGTITLTAPNQITEWLADATQASASKVQAAWQAYIDAFANTTLYEAAVRMFTDDNAPGGVKWTETDFEFFGALGTGFGGMGPLFPLCFLDIIRFTINSVDSDQHEMDTGVESFVRGFLNQKVTLPDGSSTFLGSRVVTSTPVTGVASTGSKVTLTFGDGSTSTFDRVVVATSHRSMELTMGMGYSQGGLPLAEDAADAVRRLHMENSSKVFVETSAFWDQTGEGGVSWPRNVVGDTILRNFYTLTYPDAPSGTGALLFSYTWADDSVKQQTYTDPEARIQLLLADLATISPELAAAVETAIGDNVAQVVDWQTAPYFFGAFKLNQPGQDPYVKTLFYDFQKAGTSSDTGVYLAGDSIGFLGGWVENALQTGVTAAAGVAVSLGGTLTNAAQGPFENLDSGYYDYNQLPTASTTQAVARTLRAPGSAHARRAGSPLG